ncbi:uncharacterized protein PG986_001609 [Apiospora aurea]|uniref:ubiquitinyl hydrolase 1 n=1 Tax=Apiospora aurea TaxID=335848 RepID=A0ABR1QXA3_9PEZI
MHPTSSTFKIAAHLNDILRRLLEACHCLRNITGPELEGTWDAVAKSLQICRQLNQGRLDKDELAQAFKRLDNEHILILYVVQQNAALVIRRHFSAGEDRIIFESFEVSSPPSQVLTAEDSLQWDFPGQSLSLFLEQASLESLQSLTAKVEKAGVSVIEPRSTVDPALLSQMLMSLLEAVGVSYDAPRLQKRVRDDVNLDNAELPWRRLPFWLLLRVSIPRFLKIRLGDDEGQACYKVLIAMLLAHLLDDCATSGLVAIQGWMSKHCRDVLDESDFTLAVKTQLIYPSGSQEALDGHPHRWLIAQSILDLVEEQLIYVEHRLLKGITFIRRGDTYPTVHFLNVQAEYLRTLITQQIATGKVLGLRDPIAVPFEAEGIPHPQAEFGHPDAAIILNCLSYYYTGVNLAQMMQGLQLVLDSDDPAAEFDRWTEGCRGVPETLRNVNNINSEDEKQMRALWRYLRYSRNVLDHFMNNFVFPNHARQFSVKLQASGWDLPQFSPTGNHQRSSSFSGTNGNKWMLPLTIHQKDLPALHHTNAEVLTYLLRSGKGEYVTAMCTKTKKAWAEQQLLQAIYDKEIRVLIDAGAYILDMDNKTVARQWLGVDKKAKAAVYFRDDNRAWVTYRENRKADAPLLATSFADKLKDCVVYLDQAHTRGTDMKFPPLAKGALTLSLGQTKDSTVQAAMRLRQLKTTQSPLFVAPPEVYLSIQDVCQKDSKQNINSADVVYWLLEQTCATNEQLRGLFFAQGQDFCHRMDSAYRNKGFLEDKQQRIEYLSVLEQPERQTLEEMYGTRSSTAAETAPYSEEAIIKSSSQKLNDIAADLHAKRTSANASSGLDVLGEVEQEREVEFQVEEVRNTHEPVEYKALVFPGLHQDLHEFVASGKLRPRSSFRHAFTVAGETEIGAKHRISQASTRLFVSTEFEKTIDVVLGQRNDSFMLQAGGNKEKGCQEHVQFSADDPRGFLLDWLAFRRRGHNILHTPMGYLCQGRQLTKEHAFFSEASVEAAPSAEPTVSDDSASEMDEIEDLDEPGSGEEFEEERDEACNVL